MPETLLADQGTLDENKDYLAELVGENKKFKTVQDLARGKYEADLTIELRNRREDQLRQDYLQLKADYEARAKLEDLIDQYKTPQQSSNDSTLKVNDDKQPPYNPDEIKNFTKQAVQEIEQERKRDTNFNLVKEQLTERFGEDYKTVLSKQAKDLNLSADYIDDLARRSPTAFFKTMGLDQTSTENFQTPPRNSQRSDNFKPTAAKKRTWNYYQEMKKAQPDLYRDPKTAVQMVRDYEELGTAFEDGDFAVFGR